MTRGEAAESLGRIREIRDRAVLLEALARSRDLHIYGIGDLEEPFFSRSRFFVQDSDGAISSVAVLYAGGDPPTLLALSDASELSELSDLVAGLGPRLPDRIYAHLSPGAEAALERTHRLSSHGEHLKMHLADVGAVESCDTDGEALLGDADLAAAQELYAVSYPGNWFDPRMLSTGCYRGISEAGSLVCVAGVHVVSRRHGVAALGNIATHPSHRGRGLARRATAAVCQALLQEGVRSIGLNVHVDNAAAIACYRGLGFETVARYGEWDAQRLPGGSGA